MRINKQCNRCATIVVLGLLIATANAQVSKNPGTATVEFLFVGLGDATLIRSPEGNVALIDAGPSDDIAQLLHDRGITTIDLVIITHHHIDHYGGMGAILKQFAVKHVIENGSAYGVSQYPYQVSQYKQLLDMLAERKIPVDQALQRPTTIPLGSVQLRLLPPPPNAYFGSNIDATENDRSIGIRAEYGTVSFLITGDASKREREWWKRAIDPQLYRNATIHKLAHHGSEAGTDAAWLDEVNPKVAVVSMGLEVLQRGWKMPAQQVLQALQARRIKLYNTGLTGTVSFRTDGQRWEVFKDSPVVDPRIQRARTLARRIQLVAIGGYLCAVIWIIKRRWHTWARPLAHLLTSVGIVIILLFLYNVIGATFGLADLFWHDQARTQFIAGISVMLLFALLVTFGRTLQRRNPLQPTPAAQETITAQESDHLGSRNPSFYRQLR